MPAILSNTRTVSQLVRYGFIGATTNLLGYLIYLVLTWRWLDPKATVTLIYPIGVLLGYYGHARYTFQATTSGGKTIRRYLIAYGVGYTLNLAMLALFSDFFGYPHQFVQAVAIFVVAGVLFLLLRYFVFRRVSMVDIQSTKGT